MADPKDQVVTSVGMSIQGRVDDLTQRMGTLERAVEHTRDGLGRVMDAVERMSLRQDDIMARLDAMAGHADGKQEAKPVMSVLREPDDEASVVREPVRVGTPARSVATTIKRDKIKELPKMPVKMNEFSGTEKDRNVQTWVDQLNTIKVVNGWDDEIIIKHCVMLLSGTAQEWYLTSGKDVVDTWKEFSEALVKRFTMNINPWMATRYTQDIKQKYGESCRDFMDRVRRELRLINIGTEERVCEVFLNGCRESIAAGIIRSIGRDPVDTKELVDIAMRLEMAEKMERDNDKKKGGNNNRGAVGDGAGTAFGSGHKLQLSKVGACYICGSKDHKRNECPQRDKGKDGNGGNGNNNGGKERVSFAEWKAKLKCTICGKDGHTADYCYQNKQNKNAGGNAGGIKGKGIRSVTTVEDDSDSDSKEEKDGQVMGVGSVKDDFEIDIYVYGMPITSLVDTGADWCCMGKDTYDKLPRKVHEKFIKKESSTLAANGSDMGVLGTITIPVRMKTNNGVREMDMTIRVVKKLTTSCVIGKDFLKLYCSRLDWTPGQEHLGLKNGDRVTMSQVTSKGLSNKKKINKPRVMLIRLEKDITIKADTAVAFPGSYSYLLGEDKDLYMAEGNEKLLNDGVLMASTLHKGKTEKTGTEICMESNKINMVLQVVNTSKNDVTYHRGQVIGTLQSVDMIEKEEQEIQESMDVKQEVYSELCEKIESDAEHSALKSQDDKNMILDILSRYTHLFDNRKIGEARQAGTTVMHTINTGNEPPRRAHPYRQSPAIEEAINKEIQRLLDENVIEHSNSPWASPIVMVRKPRDTKWRMCIDYRALNKITVPDVYPLPAIDQLLYNMRDAKLFTTMDLQSAYNQIVVAPEDQAKTAFIHRTGLYQYRRMPFGLRNAPATFQRFMNMMISTSDENMYLYVMVYLDDVIIFSATVDEHGIHLVKVLAIISRHGLKLKMSKCEFAKTRVRYLGHILDGNGIRVDPEKVVAVRNMPSPKKVVELQSFLGMVGYYRRFISGFAKIANPLVKLLKKKEKWIWTDECEEAVLKFKEALTSAPVLCMPDYTKQFIVQTDASLIGIGAVLSQRFGSESGGKVRDQPVAYVSRTLKTYEKNYSATELELLAVIWALKKFRHYILGSRFLLQTDHIALASIRNTKEVYSGRLARWVLSLQEYEPFDIEYRRGITNSNADALSRLPLKQNQESGVVMAIDEGKYNDSSDISHSVSSDVNHSDNKDEDTGIEVDIGLKQQVDEVWGEVYAYCNGDVSSLSDKKWEKEIEQYGVEDGVLFRRYLANGKSQSDNLILQICLPKDMITDVLRELHDEPYSGHLSVDKTWGKVFNRYYWPSMRQDIEHYINSCLVCARRKVPKRTEGIPMLSPQVDWLLLYGPMECIAIDVIGPITTSKNSSLILTIVCVVTRFAMAIPIIRQTTEIMVQVLIHKWINVHGMPKVIISDNGSGFVSDIMNDCLKAMGVKWKYVLPYHPQSNGICERFNATLVNMLSMYVQDPKKQNLWSNFITHVVFAYNTSIHSSTGYTPYFLLFGREAIIASDVILKSSQPYNLGSGYPEYIKRLQKDMWFAHKHIQDRVRQKQIDREQQNSQLKSILKFKAGDKVMIYQLPKSMKGISKKLLSPYHGPYTVEIQFNDVSYQVKHDVTKKKKHVHVSRMKRYIPRDSDIIPEIIEREMVADDIAPIGDQSDAHDTRLRRQRMEFSNHEEVEIENESELDIEEGEFVLDDY
jgi:RNase H-like domain found in reverse transcriptase/Reverse transcriptase (RNA-dependent DNA polymerase)/Integrase zinc binding domain/Integrase core domain/Retrotransposon gag protein